MSREDIFSHYPEKLVIGAGVTAEFPAMPGQNAITLKWATGGSLLVIGTSNTFGSTFAVSNEYLLALTEIYNSNMSGTFYLMASGATVTCYLNRYRTAGV